MGTRDLISRWKRFVTQESMKKGDKISVLRKT